MGDRYIVSGVNLGILISFIRGGYKDKALKYIHEIINTQYLGTDKEAKKIINEFKKKNG